jgi:hypothetical protein
VPTALSYLDEPANNKQIGQFSSYEKQQQHFIIQVKSDLAEKQQQLCLYCCLAQEISELVDHTRFIDCGEKKNPS